MNLISRFLRCAACMPATSRESRTLVDYGFRLPSAMDNRPLNFQEFEAKIHQMMFVSATPSEYETVHEQLRVEQIIRPTGLLDPPIRCASDCRAGGRSDYRGK